MPRVTSHTKSGRATKRPYRCAKCGQEITEGQRYYKWALRSPGARSGTVYMQHTECGRPRPSQLSRRKTALIQDAILDAETAISEWTPSLDEDGGYSGGYDDIQSILEEVANVAREVGEEYQAGFDAMPEGLQQGEVAQAMEEVAQELDSWADDLESFDPSEDEPDLGDDYDPEMDESEPLDEEDAEASRAKWLEKREQALEDWADSVRNDAQDKLGEMPEYNG